MKSDDDRKIFNLCSLYSSLLLLLVTLAVKCGDGESVSFSKHYMKKGNALLEAGNLSDALEQYNNAIDWDSSSYMAYFKRATTLLALQKSKAALPDLNKCIQLKPDFTPAVISKASILLKQGLMEDALKYYEQALTLDPGNKEARENMEVMLSLRTRILMADILAENGEIPEAIESYSVLITYMPWSKELREKRSEVYLEAKEYDKAVGDLWAITQLVPDSTRVFYRMSSIHYSMGSLEEALGDIRECLKLDHDHKQCKTFYTKMKKLNKQIQAADYFIVQQQWDKAIEKFHSAMRTEPTEYAHLIHIKRRLCHCETQAGNVNEAIAICTEVLEWEPDNVVALVGRAESYLHSQFYEEAVQDFQAAIESDYNKRALKGLRRAEQLLKQSEKRDYYEILGLSRNCEKEEILRAYRKLAMVWHPDKHECPNKEAVEKKFILIADAKEVLADPGMRAEYDWSLRHKNTHQDL